MQKKTSIGGQAVIEGIMMKGPKKTALAVRVPGGSIDVEYISEKHLKDRFPIFGAPILRGVVGFVESMITGYGAMMKSAQKSGFADLDTEDEKPSEKSSENSTKNTIKSAEENSINPAKEKAADSAEENFANSAEENASESIEVNGEISAAENVKKDLITDIADNHESAAKANNEKSTETKAEEKAIENGNAKKASTLANVLMVVASVLGVALGVLLFMYLPALVFDLTNRAASGQLSAFKAVFEGILKMLIFFLYILGVSKMKDIHRVFQYHGAEHKTIFCYEKGLPLTVENVRLQSRFHPRCGTSFMVLMLVVGILLGVILTWCFPSLQQSSFRPVWVAIKILILPLICGIGYELLKFCGRHDNALTKAIAAPGLLMQRITTKEPEDSMIEVAIESLKSVIPENPEEDVW